MRKQWPETPNEESTGTVPAKSNRRVVRRWAWPWSLCEHGTVTEQTQPTRPLADRSPEEIEAFLAEQQDAYATLKDRGHKLDLTRGKPSTAQLDLSDELLRLPKDVKDGAGVDVRNYGGLEGIRE